MFNFLREKLVEVITTIVAILTPGTVPTPSPVPEATPSPTPIVSVGLGLPIESILPTPTPTASPSPVLGPSATPDIAKLVDDLNKIKEELIAATPEPTIQADFCLNIGGAQTVLPAGFYRDGSGNCWKKQAETPSPKPSIEYFAIDKNNAFLGDEIVIKWKANNSVTCAISETKEISIPFTGRLPEGESKITLQETSYLKIPTFKYYAICADKDWNTQVKEVAINVSVKPTPTPTPVPESFTFKGNIFDNKTNSNQKLTKIVVKMAKKDDADLMNDLVIRISEINKSGDYEWQFIISGDDWVRDNPTTIGYSVVLDFPSIGVPSGSYRQLDIGKLYATNYSGPLAVWVDSVYLESGLKVLYQ